MGTPNTANVAVGKPRATGGVYAGATTATLPTNSTASIHSSLTAMGYVGDAGLVQTKGGTVTTIRAWGGDPVKVIRTTDDLTYAWTFLELTTEVLLETFGQSAVTWTDNFGGQKVTINGDTLPARAYVFDMLDGDTAIRVVVPNAVIDGQVTVTFVDGQATGFPVNLIALPDSSANKAYWYLTKFAS
jgi:hypothetical protein